jgi:hypothetical protein
MAARDLGIYFPESSAVVFRFHLRQIAGPASDSWSYYLQAKDFASSSHQRRIACFQIPFPYNDSIEQQIDQVYDAADWIFILGTELHENTVKFIHKFDRPKIVWFLCGSLQPNIGHGQTFYFWDWFIHSVHFYKNVRPSILYDLKPFDVKPLMFDALLGRRKPHRDQAHIFIHKNNLFDKSITTYLPTHHSTPNGTDFENLSNKHWLWEDQGLEGQENAKWTVDMVRYHGHAMSLSQVIPLQVYNQTAYSLVCETNYSNHYVFFTEKTVKPILARRLFIPLSHRYHLARLRDLGFRTFGDIIDESFDEVEPITQRHEMALEQLRWLCDQDQEKILEKIRPIVNHNFDLMYGRDWYHDFAGPCGRIMFA